MAADAAGLRPGLVVAGHGRHVLVEAAGGERLICHPRGKKNQAVVGDRVRWKLSHDEGTIEQIEPRRNLFYRQDEIRTKSFAANLDQVLVLIAAEPEFSESQLARALIAAEAERIAPLIALNKSDLGEAFERAWRRLQPYRDMGYPMLRLALRQSGAADREQLLQRLQGKTTLVLGPSGAGKSTLINLLVPGAAAQTGEISQALNSGKHTTTSTTWYWMDPQRSTALIDSPGFQEFGLHHIEPARLAQLMPDLRPHLGQCRFYNCTHLHEPGCAVLAAVDSDAGSHPITAHRHRIYRDLFEELSQPARY
ncbi:ribosome small subunit-dependent GTPase A [Ramlibacter tataouinensis]|uniref:Small ribosomal subunit biogenesis GTPase RsgA n=1 Tax=Ramlibacter tataouinensis (strain ATCC BAA-407 / DSM 14655 / LMG 21543 / TTB310) TaxID=365046 RepID=F5Y1Q0_RAMTT|nr:ribosome small subunit-dependent GTPase A [Ramlibacter tataouinensis]AEG92301.1 candidate GTPase [Ramlibacter tataouinensis TTB310]